MTEVSLPQAETQLDLLLVLSAKSPGSMALWPCFLGASSL